MPTTPLPEQPGSLPPPEVNPDAAPLYRPLLRGVSHLITVFAVIPVAIWLVQKTPDAQAARHATVYALALIALFGVSAAYHRGPWTPAARVRMRRLDHATIFVFIAGTYTPICLDGIRGVLGDRLMLTIWLGALFGVVQTLWWPRAPRALHVGIYVLLGWAGLVGLPSLYARFGAATLGCLVLGGVLYTIGAVIYARKRPDPFPRVFGYHEIFHALVIIAGGCLFEVVRRCLHVAF